MLTALFLPAALAAPPALPADARGSLAIYCPESCESVSVSGFIQRTRLPIRASQPVMVIEQWGEELGLPDAEQQQVWGNGDVSGIGAAQDVVILSWAGPREGAAARVATIGQAALAMGTWFEDLDSGMLYDAATFAERVALYAAPSPDITALTLIEGTESEGQTRLVTRGLTKVGLPELISEAEAGEENAAAIALTATAQVLYEQGSAGLVAVDAAGIASPSVREASCGIKGESVITSAHALSEDPSGPLGLVQFSGTFAGCTPAAPPPVAQPPVAQPPVAPPAVQAPSTLEEAQAAALAKLKGPIAASFQEGLAPEERLLVKAPFYGAHDRVEWLWLVVDQWRSDGMLIGRMANDPQLIDGLTRGDEVAVEADLVFDYLLIHADGQREGNTTAAFISSQ